MHADQPSQIENEYRNIKLKLKGPNRHSELQAVKALMAMSAQHSIYSPFRLNEVIPNANNNFDKSSHNQKEAKYEKPIDGDDGPISLVCTSDGGRADAAKRSCTSNGPCKVKLRGKERSSHKDKPVDLSRSESPEPIYGLAITMTEEEFKELAQREGIEDVIGEHSCKLCGGIFSGPLGIALHMCPAMKRQTYRCEICGEDKWKTKANLHSHIKWCKKRLSMKTEHE